MGEQQEVQTEQQEVRPPDETWAMRMIQLPTTYAQGLRQAQQFRLAIQLSKKRTRRKSSPTKNETIETKSKNARRRKGIKRASESSIRTSHEKITACKTKKISSTRTRKEKRNSITQKAKTNTRKKGRASQKRGS